jgi:hypothetical protein
MNRLAILLLTWSLSIPLVALAADKNCSAQCETKKEKCLQEPKTDKIKKTCMVYLKGCLKFCSQAK